QVRDAQSFAAAGACFTTLSRRTSSSGTLHTTALSARERRLLVLIQLPSLPGKSPVIHLIPRVSRLQNFPAWETSLGQAKACARPTPRTSISTFNNNWAKRWCKLGTSAHGEQSCSDSATSTSQIRTLLRREIRHSAPM